LNEVSNLIRAALTLSFLVLCSPLSGGDVKVYPTKGIDFSQYKTYQWMAPRIFTKAGIQDDDPIVAPMIRAAVNRELSTKGLREVASGGDLTVVSAGAGSADVQLDGFLVNYGWDMYWGYGAVGSTPLQRVNQKGTLAVVLTDSRTKKGVWAGLATEAVDKPEPEIVRKAVDKAAEKMFKKFPPKK